ncbi:breast cancer metastasis-suppressor 1-like protein-A [Mizuhopecten yessoensis]|uniref:Breast cancer metastasis-suppressor 1-like protein-A n=1 Tax=Mizuhopecten yessoensis TaxID=6573 RepID=A0A210QX83_MIZYE|nr:breast cancer metastasis-suppressor 1-like protein-A [Mizuhopecten yessoensis]OWF53358.1 Breast cancer metastasis-suppressor 1-like protein-A [Mizuhopecten yessoensis]
MPTIENGKGEEDEEMEHESPDSDKSSEDESELGSMDEDESDLDEEECERRKNEFLDDMIDLERQFTDLKEQLYKERMGQYEAKLEEVKAGKAIEYLNPLAELQDNMRIRIQVSGILKEYRKISIQTKFESEELATRQNMESEKDILFDSVKQDLEEKIRRLEEDRHNIDISSDLWNESQFMKKNKKNKDPSNPDRRKKPVTVAGPYIVYLLKDVDIIEDWTAIKKALKQNQKRKPDIEF